MNRISKHLNLFYFALFSFNGILNLSAEISNRLLDSADHYKLSDYKKSIAFAQQVESVAKTTGNDTLEAEAILVQGVATYLAGKHDEALGFYLKAHNLFSAVQSNSGIARTDNELGILYRKQNKSVLSKKVLSEAIRLSDVDESPDIIATSNNNLGLVYEAENNVDSAEYCYLKAFELYKSINNRLGMAYALDYLSGIYARTERLNEAERDLRHSLEIRQQLQDKTGVAIAINNLGELFLAKKEYSQAIYFFKAAYDSAAVLQFIDLQANAMNMLANVYQLTGDYKNAYDALQQYTLLNKNVMDEKRLKNIEEFEAKYESEKKENEITKQKLQLSKRNNLLITLSGILLTALFSFYFIYNRFKQQQEKRLQMELLKETEKRSKAILESEENERQRLARELHDGVGQLLTATKMHLNTFTNSISVAAGQKSGLDNSLSMLDESIREIRSISHNMVPDLLLKYGLQKAVEDFVAKMNQTKKVTLEWQCTGWKESMLDDTAKLMLYRIIQEAVSNALKYSEATKIALQLSADEQEISLLIEDNGKGFDVKEAKMKGGIGMKNMLLRTEYLKGSLDIDSSPQNGTTIIIEIPLS